MEKKSAEQIDLELDVRELGDRELEALTAQLDHMVPDNRQTKGKE